MAQRLLICGYYGFGNTGDEAILAALLAELRARRPELEITVVSGAPERTKGLHAVDAVLWTDVPAWFDALARADLVVIGGGGLYADYWGADTKDLFLPGRGGLPFYAGFTLLARALRKPAVVWAAGVGPLASDAAKHLGRAAFALAAAATVRDEESLAVLAAAGATTTASGRAVEVTADPAFLLDPAPKEAVRALLEGAGVPAGSGYLAVSLRPWAGLDAVEGELARALDRALAATGLPAVFVPLQNEAGVAAEDDVAVAKKVQASLQAKSVVLTTALPPAVTAGIMAGAELALSMRLHAALFALSAGVPTVALAYDPKVRALMARAEQSRFTLALEGLTADALAGALEAAWAERTTLRALLHGFGARMRPLAARSTDVVLEALDRAALGETFGAGEVPAPERVLVDLFVEKALQTAKLGRELDRTKQLLVEREAEVSRLQRQLAGIERSATWKLARAMRDTAVKAAPRDTARGEWLKEAATLARDVAKGGAPAVAKKLLPPALEAPAREALRRVRGLVPDEATKGHLRALDAILRKHVDAREIVLFVPSIPWDVTLFQRPQQLALALARLGVLVIYVEPNGSKQEPGFHEYQERLYLAKVPPETFTALPDYAAYVVSWNRAYLDRLGPCRVIYDYIDELDVFNTPDPEQLARDHERLLREATAVFGTARALHDQLLPHRADAILCPNGVDYAHFAALRGAEIEPPDGLGPIVARRRPIVGYYGALARWFDYELLWAVASSRPDLSFVLIGPDYDKTLENKGVFQLPNVAWLGPRHYSILPRYLRFFDVATIPFKVNAITHATSPLKLFEYMAGGKPIVTTAMQESMRYENVLVGHDAEDFAKKLDLALVLGRDPAHLALTDRVARENTWDARAAQMLEALERASRS